MKATGAALLTFLSNSPQFVIPIYQRMYSWTDRECGQLWSDILRAGSNPDISAHFIGSIVYIEAGQYQITQQEPQLVIDGQQRLATVSLLLAALATKLGNEEPVDGFSARKILNYYLLNPEEEGERRYKLLLSQTDKDSLLAILRGVDQPANHSVRIAENYSNFLDWIDDLDGDFKVLCQGLSKLMVVDISLDREHDNPQLIFESMNSTGKELSQADLIRNYVLMGLETEDQSRLYMDYWRPMEISFGQEAYVKHFDMFMRHFLTTRSEAGEIPRVSEVYEAFKHEAPAGAAAVDELESLVADVKRSADYYCDMAFGTGEDEELEKIFHDIRELKVEVAYPLFLEFYRDYKDGLLSKDELILLLRLVESYVFRRSVCAIPTNSLNRTFALFAKSIKKDRYVESVMAEFLLLPSYRRFPRNEEFERDLKSRDMYNYGNRSYWLRRLENHGRKERVPVDEFTIEHILPQNERLSSKWREALGENWKEIQERYLHTLGNLTLTGYNPEYSDKPFSEKRDMEGGFKESPIRLNSGLGQLENWNETEIRRRATRLAKTALSVWGAPTLDEDVIDAYREEEEQPEYELADHPNLAKPQLAGVFAAFRKSVMDLDPNVREQILKLYIAYKAETNFVDVVPQAARLRLSLNMPYSEINDPRGMTKDVSKVGRWGNGDVEVFLSEEDEIPYVIGLVRQSFERQMEHVE